MFFISHVGGCRFARDVKIHWQVLVLLGALLAWGVQSAVCETASPTPPPPTPVLSVSFQNGLLSVEAQNAAWPKVLKEVRAKTKIVLNVSMPLQGSVTASFKDLPVEEAFKHLFGPDANFAIFYQKQDSAATSAAIPSEVWVLGKGSGDAPPVSNPVQAVTQEFEKNQAAARSAAMVSRDHEVRLRAIAALGQQANRPSMDTLLKVAALDAKAESDIQQSAADALRGLVKNNPQAREILTEIVETDGPPEVQQLAAEILGLLSPSSDAKGSADEAPTDAGPQNAK